MDVYESLAVLGIQSGQSLNRSELKEINNTLKQIAEAQGIKVKSRAELIAEEEKKRKAIEKRRERIILEAEAKERGLSVAEYKKLKRESNNTNNVDGFFRLIVIVAFAYILVSFITSL